MAEIRQKYEQHVRLPTKIFEDKNFLSIPIKQRAYCLAILVCLLKFLNSKTSAMLPKSADFSFHDRFKQKICISLPNFTCKS
jgi:hypothetical protein